MRIWITRAEPEASATAERLRAFGQEPVVAPVLEVQPLGQAPDLKGVGALAFTSRNGVRAFETLCPERALKVFTVADATADAAREAGFADVENASGDVADLAALIGSRKDALKGEVLYPGPETPAGDLVAALRGQGIAARAAVVYRTAPAGPSAMPSGINAVLIHSTRAAHRIAGMDGVREAAPSLAAVCISPAAAEPLQALGFGEVLIAIAPNETALLQRLDAWAYAQKPVRLFSPAFWIAVSFAAACIVAAILLASLGPRLFPPAAKHPPAATAQPLQFRGKSG